MLRILTVAAVLAPAVLVDAATIRVPEDYPTVLAGVDAAVAGDSVLVAPGTWSDTDVRPGSSGLIEAAMFLRPGITVIGTAGAESTVIDAGEPSGLFLFAAACHMPGSEPARLIGLTLTSGWGAVAAVESGPLELFDCKLEDSGRRAIVARQVSILMEDCLIAGNEFEEEPQFREGAVWGLDVDFEARHCRFEGNASSGVRMEDNFGSGPSRVHVEDCEFVENGDRALLSLTSVHTNVERCSFLRNSGGGIGVNGGQGAIRFCTFAYDSAATGGGGIFAYETNAVIENNTFYRCHAPWFGSAIERQNTDGGTRNNIVVGCTGSNGPLFLFGGNPHPTTGCNLFFANEGSGYAGAWSAGPTDVFADPEFCDELLLDLRLRSSSPAAPANSACGLIGAHDVGCGPVSVERSSWGRIKGAYRARGDSR